MKKALILVAFLAYLQSFSQNMPGHPRLLLLKGEENAILRNIASDQNWSKLNNTINEESNEIIKLPILERIQIGRRLLDKSRECLRRIFFLSYSYRITKDKKYLERAEKELVKVSQFSDWNPSHFLDVAEMTLGVSIGYDWLYDDLSPESKAIIKEAILKKGIEPSLDSKNNSWLKASHNWNQVCNAGMIYGALAIYEENPNLANQIIERAKKSIELPLEDYNPDGAYPEGYSYWGYGTSFHILFMSALQKLKLIDNKIDNGFLSTAYYYQQMVGNSGKPFNYSDAGSGTGLSPSMFWYANILKDNSLLFNEKKFLNDKNMTKNRILPAVMIWGNGLSLNKIEAPKKNIFVGQGKSPVALMRTSWVKPEAIYVGLKGGSPSVNHAHMDVGSFVMDANGERWSMDLGMQEYESLESNGVKLWGKEQDSERWRVYRYNNLAHSTLAFDYEFQLVEGFAGIKNYTQNPNFLSATSDITEVYKNKVKSAKRGVAIVDQKYVLVKDEILGSNKETTLTWSMATPADVKINVDGTAELSQNGKKLWLKVASPNTISFKTHLAEPTNTFDAPNPGISIVTCDVQILPNSSVSLEVLLIPEGKDVKTKKKYLPLGEWK